MGAGKAAVRGPGGLTFVCGRITWEARQTMLPRVPTGENKASKPLAVKSVGVKVAGKTPSLTEEFVGETHRVLECIKTDSTWNQH